MPLTGSTNRFHCTNTNIHGENMNTILKAIALTSALIVSQQATAGRLIMNHDEWTLSNTGFTAQPASSLAFTQNLASYMNINGGACNLLVYSNNFGLTGSSFQTALTGAGCSVTTSTGTFDLPTLSAYDGVLLGGNQFSYSNTVLASYVNGGGSAYIAAGTAAVVNEDSAWDSLTHGFGLDFGPSYNGISGSLPVAGSHPLLAGVAQLYFNNGNTVSLFGANPNAQIIALSGGEGLLGVFDDTANGVPEPTSLGLLGLGLAAAAALRRRRQQG